jgi:N-acetylglucosaminyldiphosphoundecaprenol N-acetyl-beta-D-mannosaminyltransferase
MTTDVLPLSQAPVAAVPAGAASRPVLGLPVHAVTYASATDRVLAWARAGASRAITLAGAHGLVTAQDDAALHQTYQYADLNCPDGMPLVWALRQQGIPTAERVYGPDLMLHVCAAAAREGVPVGFYGGHEDRLPALLARMRELFPGLDVAYAYSPPFRRLTDEEDQAVVDAIAASGARILFVGLGCPKQELWMGAHRGRVPAVMLGVGAAFDFHAGFLRQAPAGLQRMGLEWAFRLAVEPRRLWRRYGHVVPRFLWLYARQMLRQRGGAPS